MEGPAGAAHGAAPASRKFIAWPDGAFFHVFYAQAFSGEFADHAALLQLLNGAQQGGPVHAEEVGQFRLGDMRNKLRRAAAGL